MPPDDKAPASDPQTRIPDNWNVIQPLLCERIRRRWHALCRLSGETPDAAVLDARLSPIRDDAAALWRFAEQIDRELDAAFTPPARRPALSGATPARDADTDPETFRVR